jgi:hypothetical protein
MERPAFNTLGALFANHHRYGDPELPAALSEFLRSLDIQPPSGAGCAAKLGPAGPKRGLLGCSRRLDAIALRRAGFVLLTAF